MTKMVWLDMDVLDTVACSIYGEDNLDGLGDVAETMRKRTQNALDVYEPFVLRRIADAVERERKACAEMAERYCNHWRNAGGLVGHSAGALIISAARRGGQPS